MARLKVWLAVVAILALAFASVPTMAPAEVATGGGDGGATIAKKKKKCKKGKKYSKKKKKCVKKKKKRKRSTPGTGTGPTFRCGYYDYNASTGLYEWSCKYQ